MSKEVAVTQQSSFVPAVNDLETIKAIIEENLGDLQPEFPVITIPAGGGIAFEVPNQDGELESVPELLGVIVDHYAVNAYWSDEFSGEGKAPDCSSNDGKIGFARPDSPVEWAGKTRACDTCPLNQFGSDPRGTGGKACKNMRRVFLIRSGEILPVMLVLPPTSIRNFTNYVGRLTMSVRPYTSVVTRVKLQKARSGGGITYSQAVFSVAEQLPKETAETMRAIAQSLRVATRSIGVTEYTANGSAAEDDAPF